MDNEFSQIKEYIRKQLSEFPNFVDVEFHESYDRKIKMIGIHAIITNKYGYYFGDQPRIHPDYSNLQQAADEFISMWKYYDNEEYINKQISMYQDFARWGTE
jgi:hypothetical protein